MTTLANMIAEDEIHGFREVIYNEISLTGDCLLPRTQKYSCGTR